MESLEARMLLSVTIAPTNNGGNGYAALDYNQSTGWVPPDTNGAAGPSSYVETVNQAIALYTNKSTGTPAITAGLSTFWLTTGGLSPADSGAHLSDPDVVYNDQIGRFVVADQDIDGTTHLSQFFIAVSKTSIPGSLGAGDWNFYQVNTTQANEDADYPGNFGYNHDAVVFSLNMFANNSNGTNHEMMISLNSADLASNVPQASLHVYQSNLNDFSIRPTTMHDSVAGDPMWLLTEHGDSKSIDVIKMTNVLSTTPNYAFTNLAVTPYTRPVPPLNPNGTVVTDAGHTTDARIQKASERGNTLVSVHTVGLSATQNVIQWYSINLSGGTPTLADQGRINTGPNTYPNYPAIDINASRQIGLTFMKSGTDTTTDYLSMYVTGRDSSDAPGTMSAPIVVPAGQGQANYKDYTTGGRAGDLSGISVDPIDDSFWAANEFANLDATANWGTAVANFTVSSPLPPTDMSVVADGPSSINAGSSATYTITISNNGPTAAGSVVLSDLLPAGSSFVSMTQSAGTDSFILSTSGGSATETATANIPTGNSDTFTLVVWAPANLGDGTPFNNTSSISAQNPDPDHTNNSATVSGRIVNPNPSTDLSVSITGPATANEGDSVTYTIKVTNLGPIPASGTTLSDTLPAGILIYKSATTSQGSFSASGGVVTFSLGTIPVNGTVTATVTAQAIEDGASSNVASVSASTPDSNFANNTASATTAFAESPIVVSSPLAYTAKKGTALTNFKVATFTHASGIESASAFSASINWGDGTTSAGTITLSGTTYTVTGSHTYNANGRQTISTTVVENGNSPASEGGNKADEDSSKHDKKDEGDVVFVGDVSKRVLSGSPSLDAPGQNKDALDLLFGDTLIEDLLA